MSEPVRRVAVVGDDDEVTAALRKRGATVVDPPTADAIVAADPDGIRVAADVNVPVLPVGAGRHATSSENAGAAVERLLDGDTKRAGHPVLSVEIAGEREGTAVFDATLVTAEPARISEYAVTFPNQGRESFRADAVVVATPLGSDGYAAAAGGPVLGPDTGLSIVPVAPFSTTTDTWVASAPLEVTVERDEERVSLVLDGEEYGEVPPNEPVTVRVDDRVTVLSMGTEQTGP
ncbi:NAD(+)/NADH kinase [Halorubrum gandharaense]